MDASWPVDIRDQCQRTKVAFFFKQWGGPNRKKTGRKLEGRTWDEIPAAVNMTKAACNY
jgi:protein gp37